MIWNFHYLRIQTSTYDKQGYIIKMVETMSESVVKLVEYGYRYNIYLYKDMGQYKSRDSAGIKRIIWVNFCRFQLILTILRFVIFIHFKNQMVRIIMADPIIKFVNRSVLMVILIGAFVDIFCMLLFMQYQELNFKSPVMNILYSVSKGNLPFSLSPADDRRLTLIIHLLTKYMVRQTYCILMGFSSAFYLYLVINAYFDPDSGLTLFWIFVWFFPIYHAFSQFYGKYFDFS